jgi:hypothetical protein
LGIATDSYDNIPYSDALQGSANLTPTFDNQQVIYDEIFALLDNAISALEGTDSSGFPVGSEDIVYGGDMDKWLRAAYTLKARYQLHLSKINGSVTAGNNALASIANGFSSNADDFQIYYNESNLNPWYAREVKAKETGNDHDKISDQLVSLMDGTSYPFENIHTDTIITNDIIPFDPINNDSTFIFTMDPRLPEYAETDDGSAKFKGYVNGGDGLSGDGSNGNTDFKSEGFYTNAEAPITLITYAEAMFIKAEATLLAAGGDETTVGISIDGYNAYIEGIMANMAKLGLNGSAYINDNTIDIGEGALMLHNIMREKYIANFLNPETYVDLRRYNFSPMVFTDLELRADHNEGDFPGEWFRRAVYPNSEVLRNPENVTANQQEPTAPVWWDN